MDEETKIYAWPNLIWCYPDELKYFDRQSDDWFPLWIKTEFLKSDEIIEIILISELRRRKLQRKLKRLDRLYFKRKEQMAFCKGFFFGVGFSTVSLLLVNYLSRL